jgi:hypothetical protein
VSGGHSSPLRSDGPRDGQAGRLDRVTGGSGHSRLTKLKGNYWAQVHLDQMVLVVVSRETGPGDQWPKGSNESQKTTLDSQGTT